MNAWPQFRALSLSVRPPRLATLMPPLDRWMPAAQRMLENYSRVWGGIGNIMVPVSAEGTIDPWNWRALRAHDPDRIAEYVPTLRGIQLEDRDAFEEWVARQLDSLSPPAESRAQIEADLRGPRILSEPQSRWSVPRELTKRILRYLSPYNWEGHIPSEHLGDEWSPGYQHTDIVLMEPAQPQGVTTIDLSNFDIGVALMAEMRLGRLSPAHEQHLSSVEVPVQRVALEESHLSELLEFVWTGAVSTAFAVLGAETLATTPLARTAVGLTFFSPIGNRDERPFYVVCGDAFSDFALGMSLNRLLGRAAWVPARQLVADSEVRPSIVRALTNVAWHLSRLRSQQQKLLFITTSLKEDALLGQLAEEIRSSSLVRDEVEVRVADELHIVPTSVQRLWDAKSNQVSRAEPFVEEQQSTTVEPLTPTVDLHRSVLPGDEAFLLPRSLTWEIDIGVEGYKAPTRSALNGLVAATAPFDREVRVSREGISYFSQSGVVWAGQPQHTTLARPRIRLPSAEDLFIALLANSRMRGQVSDAGHSTESMISLWGGLDALAQAFNDRSTNALIHSFLPDSPSGIDPGVHLQTLDRRFLSFRDLKAATEMGDDQLRDLLDRFGEMGLLLRGLILQCPRCHLANWYAVQLVGEVFTCPRCRNTGRIDRRSWKSPVSGPSIYYQLVEDAYQAVRKNCRAVVLALHALKAGSTSFLFAPEMDVYDSDSSDKVGELDVWVIRDGQILVGEANTTGSLGPRTGKRIARLEQIAGGVSADGLVFATTAAEWTEAVRARAGKSAGFLGMELRFLTGL